MLSGVRSVALVGTYEWVVPHTYIYMANHVIKKSGTPDVNKYFIKTITICTGCCKGNHDSLMYPDHYHL